MIERPVELIERLLAKLRVLQIIFKRREAVRERKKIRILAPLTLHLLLLILDE